MQHYAIPAILFMLFLIFYTPACKHDPNILIQPNPIDTTQHNGNPNTGVLCDPDSVYFQNQILPILISNCTESGCHGPADHQDGVVLSSYQQLMATVEGVSLTNWGENKLIKVLLDDDPEGRMPSGKPPLPAAQINLIQTWILQGAKNNACNENYAACDTLSVKYSTFIQPLIQSKCQGCHSGATAQGGVDLSAYQNVKTLAQNGRLYGSVTRISNWMPNGGAKLDDCTLAKMKAWINAGALNN